MNRKDTEHPWLIARIREVQNNPNGYLDLWARGHYKSTIITFAKTVQDILASHGEDPLPDWDGIEPTFGIFSHTRPIAKAFLRQIRDELAGNEALKAIFPDVLHQNPNREASRWSEDSGILVRRRSTPREATVEAWGLVDGQPTSKHFNVLIYDDVVTKESVNTPEMIQKTTEAWELSLNLGDQNPKKRMPGTRYHFADTYRAIMDRKAAIPRIYPATEDGTLKGIPVFLTQEQFDQKVREMGPYTAACQLLQNPIVDSKQSFRREWLNNHFDPLKGWQQMRRVLLCDPASKKKSTSDYTSMAVIGKGPDQNVYLLDFFRDRLTLVERGRDYLRLHKKWKPHFAAYEEYGLQADIEYIKELQEREVYNFKIIPVAGQLDKIDRINRLIPVCSDQRWYMPTELFRTTYEGRTEDQITSLIEQEFVPWPVPVHDDGLDCITRYFDVPGFDFPDAPEEIRREDRYSKSRRGRRTTWMSA